MEEAPGTSLADVWEDMGIRSKDKIIADLVAIEKKLLSVTFTRQVLSISPLGILLTLLGMVIFTLPKIRSLDAREQRYLVIFQWS